MDSVLIVGGLDYYKSVSDLLGEADLDVIEGYLLLLAVKSLSPFANQGLRQVFSPLSDLTGVSPTAEKARSDFCVDFLSETLNYALGKFFSTAAFNELAVASANDMFGRIKQSFDIGLNAAAWMDNVTLQEANQKSAVFEIITGYPSFINDTAYLKQRFALIDPKPKAFFEGVLQARQASAKDTFLLKDKERSREVQSRPIVSVFAKYTAQNNALFMPAGLLQPSCFSPTWPSFFNYGACGSIASELIMRGFDYDGSLYDAEGNKRDWWSPRTREDFEAKAQCFVDQYSEYSVSFPSGETFFIDGLLTRETNIKTTAGLANTYYAWQAERGDKDGALRNPALPGLGDFTDEQLFFISFGKQRCEKLRDEILYERLKVGDYTPPRYQVNGAVSQVDSFARAFSCPIGSKMNPKKKCSLW
ncbi:hypothetical protein DFJ73DRAFT_566338 [Zopfochytrium polystomum]|nr:hypothetical protein DFJ73DRAFT_566338 [Zopfochytrium polystomum]